MGSSSASAAAARLLALRFLSEGDGHEEDHGTSDVVEFDSHDLESTAAADAADSSSSETTTKPWSDVILASLIIQVVTMIGLIFSSAVYCCGKKRSRTARTGPFWTIVHNLVIPSFAGGALLATAVFLIIPEALNLVPLITTTTLSSAHTTSDVDHIDEEHHSEDEIFNLDSELVYHSEDEEDDHAHHYRYLQEDVHADEEEPDQPWKVGTAILAGFLFPILFWILFPRHGLEACEECENLKSQIKVHVAQNEMEKNKQMAARSASGEGDTTLRDECDAGCCEHAAHQKSEMSDEYDEDRPVIPTAAAPEILTIQEVEEEEEQKESSGTAAAAAAASARKPINYGLAASILVGDFFHNFTDGVFLGSAFLLCSRELGYTLVATTVYHELAQEVADFFLLTNHCGLLEWEALACNFVAGFSVMIGAIMVLVIDLTDTSKGIVLALSAGVYIHISASECIPRAQSKCKTSIDALVFLLCFILGAIPIGLVLLNHGHLRVEIEQCVKEYHQMMCHDILNDTPIGPGDHSTFNRNIQVLVQGKYFRLFGGDNAGVALSQHAFAHAAKLYLDDADQDNAHDLYHKNTKLILFLAIFIKYVHSPGYYGHHTSTASATGRRCMKYHQLVDSGVTGGIRCLAKHLACDCFKKLKLSTCVGKQVAFCEGCCRDLLVEKLNHCGRCRKVSYCSRECQTDDWPSHKKFCVKITK